MTEYAVSKTRITRNSIGGSTHRFRTAVEAASCYGEWSGEDCSISQVADRLIRGESVEGRVGDFNVKAVRIGNRQPGAPAPAHGQQRGEAAEIKRPPK